MKSFKIIPLVFVCAFTFGCATAPNKNLDAKVANEGSISSSQDLRTEAGQLIGSDSKLTDEQRGELAALQKDIAAKTEAIRLQSLKLRSILVKDLLSPAYSMDEVNLIEKRLRSLEDQRLSVTFNAVKSANSILGRDAGQHPRVMRAFLESGRGSMNKN